MIFIGQQKQHNLCYNIGQKYLPAEWTIALGVWVMDSAQPCLAPGEEGDDPDLTLALNLTLTPTNFLPQAHP